MGALLGDLDRLRLREHQVQSQATVAMGSRLQALRWSVARPDTRREGLFRKCEWFTSHPRVHLLIHSLIHSANIC